MTWKGLASLLVAVACANPQGATPLPEPPSLDGARLGVAIGDQVGILLAGAIEIVGEPGATDPGTTIRITNLDNAAVEPIDVDADADGGFSIHLEVPLGNELRFQPIRAGVRGEPVDAVSVEQALDPAPRHECVRVSSLHVDFPAAGADSGEVELENTCESAATLASTGARLGLTEFALATDLPLVIPPGGRASVAFDRDPGARAELEDVQLLQVVVDGEARRLPITLSTPRH